MALKLLPPLHRRSVLGWEDVWKELLAHLADELSRKKNDGFFCPEGKESLLAPRDHSLLAETHTTNETKKKDREQTHEDSEERRLMREKPRGKPLARRLRCRLSCVGEHQGNVKVKMTEKGKILKEGGPLFPTENVARISLRARRLLAGKERIGKTRKGVVFLSGWKPRRLYRRT